MKIRKIYFCVFLYFFLILLFHKPIFAFDDFSVTDFKFGLMKQNEYGRYFVFKKTLQIPYEVGSAYGYSYYYLNLKNRLVEEKIVLNLPSIAVTLSVNSNVISTTNISPSNKDIEVRSVFDANEGIWSIPFIIDKGDPHGIYKLTIFIDNKKFKEINFELIKE